MVRGFWRKLFENNETYDEPYYPEHDPNEGKIPTTVNVPHKYEPLHDTETFYAYEHKVETPPIPKKDADYVIIAIDTSEEMQVFETHIKNILQDVQQELKMSSNEVFFKLVFFNGDIITNTPKEIQEDEHIDFSFKPLCRVYDTIVEIGNWLLFTFDDDKLEEVKKGNYKIKNIYFIMISDGIDNSSTNQKKDAMHIIKRINHRGITTKYMAISNNGIYSGAELGFRDIKLPIHI